MPGLHFSLAVVIGEIEGNKETQFVTQRRRPKTGIMRSPTDSAGCNVHHSNLYSYTTCA